MASFLILGIAGVAWRSQCAESPGVGICAEAVDATVTGTVVLAADAAPAPAIAQAAPPAADPGPATVARRPSPHEERLRAASRVITSTFDMLRSPDAPASAAALAAADAAPVAVAAVQRSTAVPTPTPAVASSPEPLELSKRVVRSVRVTPEGQPVWPTSTPAETPVAPDAVSADRLVGDPFAEVVAVASRGTTSIAASQEIEPLAFASPAGAPVPHARPAARVAEVAAPEPAAEVEAKPAAKADTRVVRGAGVNVRSGPSSSRGKLFALAGGEEVVVTDEERGWLKIKDDRGRTGWVYENYVR